MEGQAAVMMTGSEDESAVSVDAHAREGGKRAVCAMRKEIQGAP